MEGLVGQAAARTKEDGAGQKKKEEAREEAREEERAATDFFATIEQLVEDSVPVPVTVDVLGTAEQPLFNTEVRREFCHLADPPSPSILKSLLEREGGAAEYTVSVIAPNRTPGRLAAAPCNSFVHPLHAASMPPIMSVILLIDTCS